MGMTNDVEREAFEEYAGPKQMVLIYHDGRYVNPMTQNHWTTWQASATHPRSMDVAEREKILRERYDLSGDMRKLVIAICNDCKREDGQLDGYQIQNLIWDYCTKVRDITKERAKLTPQPSTQMVSEDEAVLLAIEEWKRGDNDAGGCIAKIEKIIGNTNAN